MKHGRSHPHYYRRLCVCLHSDNLQSNSADGQHEGSALKLLIQWKFANNVLTNNGAGLMRGRTHTNNASRYLYLLCDCVLLIHRFRHGEPKWPQAWEAVLIRAAKGPDPQARTSPGACQSHTRP